MFASNLNAVAPVTRARRDAFSRLALWALAGILLGVHAFALNRYAVNFPFQDDFTQLFAVPRYFERKDSFTERLALLFELSVEHRIATLRLIAVAQATLLGGLNFRVLIFLGNLLCTVGGIVILRCADKDARPALAVVFACIIFSPTNFVAQYWATGALQHAGLIFYSISAIYCACRDDWRWEAAALLSSLLAAFTSANGLMVFPVVIAYLAYERRYRSAGGWLALAVVLFSCYFLGYQGTAGSPLLGAVLHPWGLTLSFLAVLGAMAGTPRGAILVGAGIAAFWIWASRQTNRQTIPPLFFAWIAFFILSSATIAGGRMGLGLEALVSSRYRYYSGVALLVTIVALCKVMRNSSAVAVIRPTLVVSGVVWFAGSWLTYMPAVGELAAVQRNAHDQFAAMGHAVYPAFPPSAFGDFLLNAEVASGRFVPNASRGPLVPRSHFPAFAKATVPLVHLVVEDVGDKLIAVRGVVKSGRRKVSLWLHDGENFYRCKLPWQRLYVGLQDDDLLEFWGVISLTELPKLSYRIGLSADSEVDSAIHWTERHVDLRDVDGGGGRVPAPF